MEAQGVTTMAREVVALEFLIPDVDYSHEAGYCAQPSAMKQYEPKSGKFYWNWEQEVAKPALEQLGYTVLSVVNGESDSFGPLSRIFHLFKDGVRTEAWYG